MKNYFKVVDKLFKIHKKYYTATNTPLHLLLFSKISYFVTPFFLYFKFSANSVTLINFFFVYRVSVNIVVFPKLFYLFNFNFHTL